MTANHISARSQPLAIITIECVLKSGADRTNDVRLWVKDLFKQSEVEHALGLSNHHVDIRYTRPCHVDGDNTVDFDLTQKNPGSCHASPCGGSFTAGSPVHAQLFNALHREMLYTGDLSTTT